MAVVSLGASFLLAAILPALPRLFAWLATILIALAALAGAGVSGRHVYIQSLPPDKVPVCGATLDYMLEIFSKTEVLRKGAHWFRRVRQNRLDTAGTVDARLGIDLRAVAGRGGAVLVNWPAKRTGGVWSS